MIRPQFKQSFKIIAEVRGFIEHKPKHKPSGCPSPTSK